MNSIRQQIAEQLAEISLSIGAIKLSPAAPFKWASGYYMPIYNDNRMLLGEYEHRMLVARGFAESIKENRLGPVAYAGTSTAGIAPAAILAHPMNWPLFILHEGRPIDIVLDYHDELLDTRKVDVIASTCPWAIYEGVALANKKRQPFAYVRQSKKTHGLMQQIEGKIEAGNRVVLLDYYNGKSYCDAAVQAIQDRGAEVVIKITHDSSLLFSEQNVSGRPILLIEDLISTGGSSLTEFNRYKELGAEIDTCLAIFDYGLEKAAKQFREAGCAVHAVLTYDILLSVAERKAMFLGISLQCSENGEKSHLNGVQDMAFSRRKRKNEYRTK